MHIWGCLVEAKLYNPQEKLLTIGQQVDILFVTLSGRRVTNSIVHPMHQRLLKPDTRFLEYDYIRSKSPQEIDLRIHGIQISYP